MTSRDFIFWLKGYLENAEDSKQKQDIKKALKEIDVDKEDVQQTPTIRWTNGTTSTGIGNITSNTANSFTYDLNNTSTYDTTLKSLSKINGFYVKNNLDKSN